MNKVSYEIQVSKYVQRSGLGRILTQQLISIGTAFEMQKVMLTVFKGPDVHNYTALVTDVLSSSKFGCVKLLQCPWVILPSLFR
jgi:hypothetical protein